MHKWYEDAGNEDDIIVVSRIRLLRNIKGYRFPARLSAEEKRLLPNRFLKHWMSFLPGLVSHLNPVYWMNFPIRTKWH